jgi:hypothetical protein
MRLEGAINKECPGLGWASGQEGKPEIGQASGTFPEASGPERGRRWDLASQGREGEWLEATQAHKTQLCPALPKLERLHFPRFTLRGSSGALQKQSGCLVISCAFPSPGLQEPPGRARGGWPKRQALPWRDGSCL